VTREAPKPGTCPVEITLQVIAGKWKPVILWYLSGGTLRFGELKRTIPGITQRMLTQQLRELERDGIVARRAHDQVPPKVEYSITEFGRTLKPLLEQMCRWGEQYSRRLGVHEAPGERRRAA